MSNDNYISSYSGSQVDGVLGLFHGKGLDQVTGLVQRNADGTFSVGSGGESDIFVATPNVTTYLELVDAINANKIIFINDNIIGSADVADSVVSLYDCVYLDGDDVGGTFYEINTSDVWSVSSYSEEFQYKLVSGTNIKTINNTSLLGSGNIDIQSGASNWLNGSAAGSVKTVYSALEDDNYTIGNYAVAEGSNTKASGSGSHAEGSRTTASGDSSHAEGYITIASGSYSHVEGYGTTASGRNSHAGGDSTIAQRASQTVIGEFNIADTTGMTNTRGDYAFIVGNGTGAYDRSNALTVDWSGNIDIDSGAKYKINGIPLSASDVGAQETLVSGTNIKTINSQSLLGSGNLTISSGLQNLVDGSATGSVRGINTAAEDSSYTMGINAFAEGDATKASGDYAHAEGATTIASGEKSHAEGATTIASGEKSHAEGIATRASGTGSHAEGTKAKASGKSSHAEGWNTTASGDYSHAGGQGTIAARLSQTVIGEYNIKDITGADGTVRGSYALIIGNGSDSNNHSNALTVDWQGNVDIASGASYKINGVALSASDVGAQPVLTAGTGISIQNNVISVNLPNAEGGEF